MYGLSSRELRFALVLSSSHFTQHVFYRTLPPLIPVLAVALSYPLWQLGLLISIYSLGMGVTQAPFGVLSDRVDRRFLLPTGLALTGAAYVLFSFAPVLGASLPSVTLFDHVFGGEFVVMSLAMLVVGVGLSVVHPSGYPMITDNVDEGNKGKVLGVFGASSKLGDAAAPAVIAVLILLLAWEQIILVFGVAGVVYGVALFAVLGSDEFETVPSGRRNAASEESDDGTDANEDGDADSDSDRRSFLYPILAVYFFFISSMLSTRGLNSFLPAFVVAVYAFTFEIGGVQFGAESVANVYFSVLLVAGAAMQLFLGSLADSHDPRRLLIYCMAIAAVGIVLLSVVDLHPLLLFVVVAALGTGLYGVNPARDALVSDITPADHEGRTFGFIFTAVNLTGAPLPAVIGYLLEVAGMRGGFLLLAAGPILAGTFIALLYSDRVYVKPGADAAATPSD